MFFEMAFLIHRRTFHGGAAEEQQARSLVTVRGKQRRYTSRIILTVSITENDQHGGEQ